MRERLQRYAQVGVIIGVSAGAIIMTPNISYSQLCGDENEIGLTDLKGLALVNFHFVPHAIKGETIAQDLLFKSQQDSSKVVVASDRDWMVIDGSKFKVYGEPRLVRDGEIINIKHIQQEERSPELKIKFF